VLAVKPIHTSLASAWRLWLETRPKPAKSHLDVIGLTILDGVDLFRAYQYAEQGQKPFTSSATVPT